jgi:hypothetical protein
MPLNIGGSGSIKPYVKYNAKADKWFVRAPEGGDLEIARPTFLLDLKNISTGWLRFLEGQAPERVIDPSLEQPAPSPGDGFKRGFVIMAFSQKFFGGAVEFSSASIHLSNSIREVYAAFEEQAGKPENRGKVPVIACAGSDPMKDKFGTNYKPRLEIVKWADRPAELPDASPVDDADVWKGAHQQQQAARHVPPPAAQAPAAQAPARDSALETEF